MKLRKFLCLFIMALLVFAISGCGGSSHHGHIIDSTDEEPLVFSSDQPSRNALLITDTSSDIQYQDIYVYKKGDAVGSNYDKDGDNAAILVKDGAKPMFNRVTVSSDAKGAHAVFSYGGGTGDGTTITIHNSKIYTNGDSSSGIMATGGGRIDAADLEITTEGQSSPAIRAGHGGGTISVERGTYKTSGQSSPVIRSAGNITVKEADLEASLSQGVVIDGGNSVTLDSVNITTDHKVRDENGQTHQAVLLYYSGSEGVTEGTSTFTMDHGNITSTNGDTFCVTNTNANINLTDVTITNNDQAGYLLIAEGQKWGRSGSNGGHVTLNATNQNFSGDIVVDSISSFVMNLIGPSNFTGAINPSGRSGSIDIILDSDSKWTLTNNSNITSLSGDVSIDYGSYTLDVNGYSYNKSIPFDPNGTVSKDVKISTDIEGYHLIVKDTGTHHYENITVTKNGGGSETPESYTQGANAAILSGGNANISILGSSTTITTNAIYATAVFANGGTVSINEAKIRTSGNNSDGLTAANDGTVKANGIDIITSGVEAVGIRTINGGNITANTSVINASNSQGIVMDGGNEVSLKNDTITAKQAILISGDAREGMAVLNIEGGTITNNMDEVIRVTNSKCNINLNHVSIVNNATPRIFLNTNTDESVITLEAKNQDISGSITTGSTLKLNLRSGSNFTGSINSSGQRGIVNVILDTGATWTLDADSYVHTMSGGGSSLIRNGHKLYENGIEYTK